MIRIRSIGAYTPDHLVSNDDLSKIVDTSDEWIYQRVGIKTRSISLHDHTYDMGEKASRVALERASLTPADIDLILCATVSSEDSTPSTAAMIQYKLGATCPAMDISAACSGFIYLLETAKAFIALGYQRILCVSAERMSRLMDWTDRNTCVIFGDGAAALVVEPGDNDLATKLVTRGGDSVIKVPNFQGNSPYFKEEAPKPYIYMNGQETFKFAVKSMIKDIRDLLEKASLDVEDISWVVPHQANTRIIDTAKKKLDFPEDKYVINIERYGNTSAASVPIALNELYESGRLKRGDLMILCAFGGGLTSAGMILRW